MNIRSTLHLHKLALRLLGLLGLTAVVLVAAASVDGLVGVASAEEDCNFANPCRDGDGHRLHYFAERDCGRNPYRYNDLSGEWERNFYEWCYLNNHDPFEVIFNNMAYFQVQQALNSVGLGSLSHDDQLKGLIRLGYWREEGYGPGDVRPRVFKVPAGDTGGRPVTVVGTSSLSSVRPVTPVSTPAAPSTGNAPTPTPPAGRVLDLPADGQYVVKGGDSMWGIATRYGISPYELIGANPGIDPNVIVPGMVLHFPTSQ